MHVKLIHAYSGMAYSGIVLRAAKMALGLWPYLHKLHACFIEAASSYENIYI